MIASIPLLVAAIIFICLLGLYFNYRSWRAALVKKLKAGGRFAILPRGPVEYASIGKGPTLLISHGGGTGYDNVFFYESLVTKGFRVVCPSKPGYLRTPVYTGTTFEEQADLFAEFLDSIDIRGKVGILGVSLGGPAALQFALRHPERVSCLVMQDAVSMEYHANEEAKNSILGRMFLSKSGRDFIGYMMDLFTRLTPESIFRTYLKVETTYDKKQISKLAREIMSVPENRVKLSQFSQRVSPMGLRSEGMDMEMDLVLKLPKYPLERITVPTLVTQSRVDKDVSREHGEFVAKTVKGAELYEFDGCGHLFWFGEEGEKVNAKLIEFLKKNLV